MDLVSERNLDRTALYAQKRHKRAYKPRHLVGWRLIRAYTYAYAVYRTRRTVTVLNFSFDHCQRRFLYPTNSIRSMISLLVWIIYICVWCGCGCVYVCVCTHTALSRVYPSRPLYLFHIACRFRSRLVCSICRAILLCWMKWWTAISRERFREWRIISKMVLCKPTQPLKGKDPLPRNTVIQWRKFSDKIDFKRLCTSCIDIHLFCDWPIK